MSQDSKSKREENESRSGYTGDRRIPKVADTSTVADGENVNGRSDTDGQHLVWLDVSERDETETAQFSAGFNAGVDVVLSTPDQLDDIKIPQSTQRAVTDTELTDEAIENYDIIVTEDPDRVPELVAADVAVGVKVCVEDQQSMDRAVEILSDDVEYGIVELRDETNIPLELLIAECQDNTTSLLKIVASREEMEVAFGVLENGTDGVVVQSDDLETVMEVTDGVTSHTETELELYELTVTAIEHVNMGSRNCVDTTTLLTKAEGMIVGSQSTGGVFVCSETHPLPYMDLRPFRVNAGAVHSYIWGPNERTRYLSELEVGDEVLAVNTDGTARPVTVGRSKIEERPLLLIQCEFEGEEINVVLQDDWHVRVMGPDGEPINITELQEGDTVLGHVTDPGRHVGVQVEETIVEK